MSGRPGRSARSTRDDLASTGVTVVDLGAPDAVDALARAAGDPSVVGIVITGGPDPAGSLPLGEPPGKPVVLALSGRIDAATLLLACRCDVRVASDSATMPTADLPASGVLPALADLVGAARLPELLLAPELPAPRLRELGLVSELVTESELQSCAVRYARRFAALGTDALTLLRNRRLPGDPAIVAGPASSVAAPVEDPPGRQPDLRVVPGARSGAQTRQKILDAAARVLRTHGYTACRLADIAKLCGTHQTSVYHYFPSKEALVDEVLRVGVTRTFDEVRAAVETLPDGSSALDRLAVAIRAHLRVVLASGDYASAAMSVTGELPKESYERIRGVQHDYGQYWSKLYADAGESGYLRPGTNLSVVRAFIAGALNYAIEWYDPVRGGVDDLADEFIPMILSGLAEPERVQGLDLKRTGRNVPSVGMHAEPAPTRRTRL